MKTKYHGRANIKEDLQRIESYINLYLSYGDTAFPNCFRNKLDYDQLVNMRECFKNNEFRVKEAQLADVVVRAYLSDVLGPLVIKKVIPASVKVMCCNELGISEDIFNQYVCYREITDTVVKLYPHYCG